VRLQSRVGRLKIFACDAQSQFWFVVVIHYIQTDGPQNS
jgi:hypothetical protein